MIELIVIFIFLIFVGYLNSKDKKQVLPKFKPSFDNKIIDNSHSNKPIDDSVQINQEKLDLFNKIENSDNHFFVTGKAGTGKSLLLSYIKSHSSKKMVVTAPTGVAAINVGGQTIHSLFVLPPSFVSVENLQFNQKSAELLRHVEMILIDEISMVRADLMDAIDYRIRQARDDPRPFGGIQIVMFGDLYQLPPIVSDRELHKFFADNMGGYHFFNAKAWQNANFEKHELQEVFRQKDQNFRDLLNAIRVGEKSPEILKIINDRFEEKLPEDGYVYLCSTNSKASQINSNKLAKIDEPEFTFKARISGELDEKSYPADETLILKKGAQIMMLKNDIDKKWVNGTVGTIASISEKFIEVKIDGINYSVQQADWKKIRYHYNRETKLIEEETISSFVQYPIRLAWAITIHKAQGKTFDKIVVDLEGGTFAPGQTYVALSRCTSLEGVYLTDKIYSQDIKVDPDVVRFMSQFSTPIKKVYTEVTPTPVTKTVEVKIEPKPVIVKPIVNDIDLDELFPDIKTPVEKKKISQELDW